VTQALNSEQIHQIVNNTLLVILARPELRDEWRANLLDLLQQARHQGLEDEMLFVAAVLSLLETPNDRLPTGTVYDYAWEALLTGLTTGKLQPLDDDSDLSMERLLRSVAEALVAVLTVSPDQRDVVAQEVHNMHQAAQKSNASELHAWLTDVLAVLDGTHPATLGQHHKGLYADYWQAIVANLPNA